MAAPWLSAAPGGVRVLVLAQPRASRSRVVGVHDGRLKVQLAAPPVDGEANDALLAYLSDVLGVPKRQLALDQGATGRRKTVSVSGMDAAAVESKLGALVR